VDFVSEIELGFTKQIAKLREKLLIVQAEQADGSTVP
jgi:hypothetical protein